MTQGGPLLIFSAPEPKAQVHYCDHALSVVRPSVRPSSLTFHIFDFSSETAKRNSTKLDRKQDLNVLYQVCVFRADRKNKMAALASDWLRHFRLLHWNRLQNSTKLDRKQDVNILYKVCVFRADRKNKMAALASDWLRHFWLLLWNRWTEFNETLQEERSQRPLPSFFGPIGKTRWLPWPIRQKGGTLYSGARYVALWASCLVIWSKVNVKYGLWTLQIFRTITITFWPTMMILEEVLPVVWGATLLILGSRSYLERLNLLSQGGICPF